MRSPAVVAVAMVTWLGAIGCFQKGSGVGAQPDADAGAGVDADGPPGPERPGPDRPLPDVPGGADVATPPPDGTAPPGDRPPADMTAPGPDRPPPDVMGGPVCGNGAVEMGETCDPVAQCTSRQAACTNTADRVRTPSGDPNRCTFVCMDTARMCGPGDGFCPTGCAAAADPDCRRPTGMSCNAPGECVTGNCVTGFCCDTPCAGGCFSCAAAATGGANGTCAAVRAGMDPRNGCTRAPDSSCGDDGECDGSGNCRKLDANTVCAAATCSGGTATPVRRCTGGGACAPPASTTMCGLFTCDATTCKTSCSGDGDCIASHFCEAPACRPRCQLQNSSNLLANGGFDSSFANWRYEGVPENAMFAGHDSMDGRGCATSGSGRVGGGSITSDCFGGVQANTTYHFGFMKRVPTGAMEQSFCAVAFFDGAGCTGNFAGTGGVDQRRPFAWIKESITVMAGAGAISGNVVCYSSERNSLFDRIYVNASGPEF